MVDSRRVTLAVVVFCMDVAFSPCAVGQSGDRTHNLSGRFVPTSHLPSSALFLSIVAAPPPTSFVGPASSYPLWPTTLSLPLWPVRRRPPSPLLLGIGGRAAQVSLQHHPQIGFNFLMEDHVEEGICSNCSRIGLMVEIDPG
jgi:hypothetical protein